MTHHIRTLAASFIIACAVPAAAFASAEPSAGSELAQARAIVQNLLKDNANFVREAKEGYFAGLKKGQQPRATT